MREFIKKLIVVYILAQILFIPSALCNYSCVLPGISSQYFSNSFVGGFTMCGTALAASGTCYPSDAEVSNLKKRILNAQKGAPLIRAIPHQMIVDKPTDIKLTLDTRKMELSKILRHWADIYGNISTSVIDYFTDTMEAKVSGEGFEIVKHSEDRQSFPRSKIMTWAYTVTPKHKGKLTLHVEIYAIKKGKERTHAYEEYIDVESTTKHDIKEAIGTESTLGTLMPWVSLLMSAISLLTSIILVWWTIKQKHKP